VRTHQIHVSNGREAVHEIRRQLFLFPEVIEVFDTGRPDVLVVVYIGRPRPGEWLKAVRALGYRTPPRGHATSASRPISSDRLQVVATSSELGALR
jgi:hypothetical protein